MIIGIDIGTKCGWAVLDEQGNRRDSGVWVMTPRKATKTRPADARASRWLAMLANCRALFRKWQPVAVVYERPVGGGPNRNSRTVFLIHGGLLAQLEIAALESDDAPVLELSPTEWKTAAAGHGHADKPRYIAAANERHRLNLGPKQDDEAAALGIAYAAIKLGKVPFV